MTDKELEEKATEYLYDKIDPNAIDCIEEPFSSEDLENAYKDGYRQAEKDLSCVQQRLNMLEDHNMTIDNVISCLEKHNEIHSRQEPRAYYITKALNIAIDFLKNYRWHYPSKGEFPKLGDKVLIKVHGRDDVVVGSIFYLNAFTLSLKRWETQTDDVDRFYSDKEILAWQYLPEPPKEM